MTFLVMLPIIVNIDKNSDCFKRNLFVTIIVTLFYNKNGLHLLSFLTIMVTLSHAINCHLCKIIDEKCPFYVYKIDNYVCSNYIYQSINYKLIKLFSFYKYV